jgi:hypothetical protein
MRHFLSTVMRTHWIPIRCWFIVGTTKGYDEIAAFMKGHAGLFKLSWAQSRHPASAGTEEGLAQSLLLDLDAEARPWRRRE